MELWVAKYPANVGLRHKLRRAEIDGWEGAKGWTVDGDEATAFALLNGESRSQATVDVPHKAF